MRSEQKTKTKAACRQKRAEEAERRKGETYSVCEESSVLHGLDAKNGSLRHRKTGRPRARHAPSGHDVGGSATPRPQNKAKPPINRALCVGKKPGSLAPTSCAIPSIYELIPPPLLYNPHAPQPKAAIRHEDIVQATVRVPQIGGGVPEQYVRDRLIGSGRLIS